MKFHIPFSLSLSFPLEYKASEYFTDSPDQLNEPVMHFAQVGPPKNVTVQQTDVGDEFIVSWYPPDYGIETLRVYVVRWFREPGHHLVGTAETRDTYYKGNLLLNHKFLYLLVHTKPQHFVSFFSPIFLWHAPFFTHIDFWICFFLPFPLAVRYLMENELYSFQVFSLSTTDYQAGSNEYDIRVPAYRIKMRLVAIIITLIILSMLVFAAIYIFLKKRCFEPYADNDEKLQRP